MVQRKTLTRLIKGGMLAIAGVLGVPALLAASSPALKGPRAEAWQQLGLLEAFPVGKVRPAVVTLPPLAWSTEPQAQAVYVWRPSIDEVVVYSRSCTDLGCPINWDAGSEVFFCPCHGGIFAKNGERMAGPPPRPLYRYARRVRDGRLEIDLNSLPPMT